MAQMVIRRFTWSCITLLGITTITFFLMNLLPGGPFSGLQAGGRTIPEAQVRQIEARYGLDKPLLEQFGIYLWGLAHGDFGYSLSSNARVTTIVREGIPVSLTLGSPA